MEPYKETAPVHRKVRVGIVVSNKMDLPDRKSVV